jgi:hypothetical protein
MLLFDIKKINSIIFLSAILLLICISAPVYWYVQYSAWQKLTIDIKNMLAQSSTNITSFANANYGNNTQSLAGTVAKNIFQNILSSQIQNVKVVGIVQDIKNNNHSYALIRVDSKSSIYKIGQNLAGGVIQDILSNKIILSNLKDGLLLDNSQEPVLNDVAQAAPNFTPMAMNMPLTMQRGFKPVITPQIMDAMQQQLNGTKGFSELPSNLPPVPPP